jgi:sterol desaturase/sphingolipid hydroxylase (fatty acid hydroxylase superfamily)
LAGDLFYLGINASVIQIAYMKMMANQAAILLSGHALTSNSAPAAGAAAVQAENLRITFVLQVVLILASVDFVHYWLHRAMHRWYPLWTIHASHHFVTQLNALKSNVTHPISIYLWGFAGSLGGFWLAAVFHMEPRAGLAAGAVMMSLNVYQHANVRFTPPCWWGYLFNTVEHHSLHHSRTFAVGSCNYATVFILFDRIFGTYRDGQEEFVGLDGGRRISLIEQMLLPLVMLLPKRRKPAKGGA